jgi:glycogen phosphorylase
MPGSATAGWAGWRPASWIRWRRLAFPEWVQACVTSTGSSSNPSVTAGSTSGPITGWRVRTRGKSRGPTKPSRCVSPVRSTFTAARCEPCQWLKAATGQIVDPDSIFDGQIKRIHEYKRQLLNALHIVVVYRRLLDNPTLAVPPRTFFFAGKAAPSYQFAKLVIKFINNLARTIDREPLLKGRLKVVFVPDYGVSVAERLIPASDVSEQISTAGYEASGTGNMKFMMNGALTIGTRDGATIEMADAAGEENLFLFGLSADEVAATLHAYEPRWHYEHDAETRTALDLIANNAFSRDEPGVFGLILDALLRDGDRFLLLADLKSYADAQTRVGALYSNPEEWWRKAVLNIAAAGRFSSDRTIAEYVRDIWHAQPCPIG